MLLSPDYKTYTPGQYSVCLYLSSVIIKYYIDILLHWSIFASHWVPFYALHLLPVVKHIHSSTWPLTSEVASTTNSRDICMAGGPLKWTTNQCIHFHVSCILHVSFAYVCLYGHAYANVLLLVVHTLCYWLWHGTPSYPVPWNWWFHPWYVGERSAYLHFCHKWFSGQLKEC